MNHSLAPKKIVKYPDDRIKKQVIEKILKNDEYRVKAVSFRKQCKLLHDLSKSHQIKLTYNDIAELFGVSVITVKNNCSKGTQEIKGLIKKK